MNHARLIAVCGLLFLVALTDGPARSAFAEDWPAWRGPRADGVSTERHVPLTWSSEKNVRWKTEIAGVGHSSPIIHGNAIFITSADPGSLERYLFRLDRRTGDVVWRRSLFKADFEKMHKNNTPASATPSTDGERVYVTFCDGDKLYLGAFAFDDGSLVWEARPGGFISHHGFHTCPVLSNGRLFLNGQQDSDEAFVAMFDAQSGRLDWKVPRGKAGRSFSVPRLINVGGHEQLVLSGATETVSYRTDDGTVIWRLDGPAEKTVSSLVFDGERLFVAGGRDGKLFALQPTGAVEEPAVRLAWQGTRGIPYISSPLLVDGILHVVSDEGVYTRYQPQTGKILLQKRLAGTTSSSLVAAAGRVYLTDESGKTVVVTSGPEFKILATNELEDPVFASIAISEGELFLRGKSHLYCIHEPAAPEQASNASSD